MRNKLLVISIMAIIGITGCSKEEETAAISPGVEKVQPAAAVAPEAQPAPVAEKIVEQTAPAVGSQPSVEPTTVVDHVDAAKVEQPVVEQPKQ